MSRRREAGGGAENQETRTVIGARERETTYCGGKKGARGEKGELKSKNAG